MGGWDNAISLVALPANTTIVSDDGAGHADTLVSIEKIIGSIYSDQVRFFGNQENVKSAGKVLIDAGTPVDATGDVADFSGMSDKMAFHLQNGDKPVEGITLVNFENIVGTNYDDRLKFEGNAQLPPWSSRAARSFPRRSARSADSRKTSTCRSTAQTSVTQETVIQRRRVSAGRSRPSKRPGLSALPRERPGDHFRQTRGAGGFRILNAADEFSPRLAVRRLGK